MRSDEIKSALHRETRRQFIKRTGMATAMVAGGSLLRWPASARGNDPAVSIVLDASDTVVTQPPVSWAAEQLRAALSSRGVAAQICQNLDQAPAPEECILVSGRNSIISKRILDRAEILLSDAPEALALARGKIEFRSALLVAGSDATGLVYALLELVDRMNFAADPMAVLQDVEPVSEHPVNAIRSVGRAFVSNVEDLPWFNDRNFWPAYLTLLAAQRSLGSRCCTFGGGDQG